MWLFFCDIQCKYDTILKICIIIIFFQFLECIVCLLWVKLGWVLSE
jgi:hypothetical protein